MVRVLQIFYGMDCGGAENMIMNLYRGIDRTKVQFDFVVHTEKKCFFDDEILALGGRIYHAPEYKVVNHFYYKKWWRNFLKNHEEYKIIHGHMYSIAPIYLKVAKNHGLITIIHSHSTSETFNIKELVKSCLRLKAKNSADHLFACSAVAGEWLYGRDCANRKNYVLLKNAIDTDKYSFDENVRKIIREELKISDKFVVGHVGSFGIPKNHTYLLDVFKRISLDRDDAILLLVGDGNLRAEIENKIKELDIEDKVIMTGVRSDVDKLMQAMDCFVFPSLYEGLPVTVIEAQAAGLSCFISDTITEEVSITDLVERLPINVTPNCWSNKILEKMQSYKREDMKQKIIDAGYAIKQTANWLTDFYLEITQKN